MTPDEIREALAAPFPASELKWKPQKVSGERALAVAYIDCRAVQNRLDDVLGIANWQEDIVPMGDGSALCKLSLRISGEWITRCDVGSPSQQPDEGDRRKAAVSDALKRAAVKFGVGRYLYAIPVQWCPYDAESKRITQPPTIALPKPTLIQRLVAKERELSCRGHELIEAVRAAGHERGLSGSITGWGVAGIEVATETVKSFQGVA